MRVTLCVDALEPHPGGIGRYTWELCKGLAQGQHIDDLAFYARARLLPDPQVLLTSSCLPRRSGVRRVIDRWKTASRLRSSLVHGPNYFLPQRAERGVITVHDLSVFKYPETHPAKRVQDFERRFLHSLRKASHVITDTETIREEVIEMFGVHPHSITAVPLGVDVRFRPLDEENAEVFKAWGIEAGRYGLCISTLEPRKKIFELLRAWRELPQPVRARFPLVLAGGSGWNNEALHEEIARASAEGWLRHLGFVEEQKLPTLYAGAALFLYPSIYEGFGLPPLEAMASGVPVLVSGGSCMQEVGGDAPRYVNPDDIAGFTLAVEDSLTDENWRSEAVRRGLERTTQFTWARCIDATAGVYRKLICDQ